jgi:two-component system nitrogen regulation sensor histidine kinase GlnL
MEDPARLLLELRELDQQIRIAREAKLVEHQQANRELIRNLAHEIKNPLGGIRGAAQLLERELPGPELREFTQVIVKEADRLQSLMNRLLTPSRLPQIEMINVHEVMERVRTLVLAEHPEGLAVRRDYDVSLPDLPGDKESLIQAVLNVARNAAQAMNGRGQIAFRTRVARQVTIAKARYRLAVAVEIEDNGPGVPENLADKIFYPLVTGRDGGSGLGLSLAQSYVHQHQGLIEFESVPGRTCFTILLPVRSPAQAGLARPPSEGDKP